MPNDPKPGQKVAMISSTSVDLPEHRQQAIDACLRQSVFPLAMEHLPASDADAIRVSTEMIEKADIYIGVFAWRYGHVPEGHDISITEMEFNRAVERGIPILVFTIHDEHPLTIKMVETDTTAQEKLKQLKERACEGRGRLEFSSPIELRSHIIQSLGKLLAEMDAAKDGQPKVINFHPPNLIPTAPTPYIAHPYSLLQTSEVVGRREELKLLTDWVTSNKIIPPGICLFNVVAIGGMGKSALTWKWFNDIAPNELPHLAGRMWWSFYESDAYFENFVIRALAYTDEMTEAAVRELPAHEREDRLFHLLDQQPFLLVLDGLERILLAYSRMDAAHLADDDLDEKTANEIARFYGLPDEVKETYLEKHRLRQCADPRAGRFLQRLTRVRASRVLVSTRLYPAELQTVTAQPSPGCYPLFLKGLTDDDALALWREFIGSECSGTNEQLLPLFNAFGNYPLLVRALAGRVANYRYGPFDYDLWRKDHPHFNPAELDLRNAKTHVLHYALEGLSEAQRQALHTLAAFRIPAAWETLRAVLVGKGKKKPCPDDRALGGVLMELEDRGLVAWDRRANRYDLHPLVRGVVWGALGNELRRGVYTSLHAHFAAVPEIDEDEVSRLEDLTPTIELYHTLIGLGRYDDAFAVFHHRLGEALAYRLSATRQLVELAEGFFPDGLDAPPRLQGTFAQGYTISALGTGLIHSGRPGASETIFRQMHRIFERSHDLKNVTIAVINLAEALLLSGKVRLSETSSCSALLLSRDKRDRSEEAWSLYWLGLAQVVHNAMDNDAALLRALRICLKRQDRRGEGLARAYLAQRALWLGEFAATLSFASRARELAHVQNHEADFIRATHLQGAAALGLGDFAAADERLHHALTRARQVNFVEEELPVLAALAELRRQQGKPDEARDYLNAAWDSAERGPYPLFHADALNVLAQLEHDAGNTKAAIEAATKAYRLAWCDGPPYAYHWGLIAAQKHLEELGAPLPDLPPFDPSKFEPMPEVEINPNDEFYVEVDTEEHEP